MRITMRDYFLAANQVAADVVFDEPLDDDCAMCSQRLRGLHCKLGDNAVGLFVYNEKLFLFLNGRGSEARRNRITASFHSYKENRRLDIRIGQSLTTIVHTNSRLPAPEMSSPGIEPATEQAANRQDGDGQT